MALVDQPIAPALGNFYFSPVRVQVDFDPSYPSDVGDSSFSEVSSVKSLLRKKFSKRKATESEVSDDEDSDEEIIKDNHVVLKKKKRITQKLSFWGRVKEWICDNLTYGWFLFLLLLTSILLGLCAYFLFRNLMIKFLKTCCFCCFWCIPWIKKKSQSIQKKEERRNLIDVEGGMYPYRNSSRKNKKNTRLVDTGTQDSRSHDLKKKKNKKKNSKLGIGCSPCCRRKDTR